MRFSSHWSFSWARDSCFLTYSLDFLLLGLCGFPLKTLVSTGFPLRFMYSHHVPSQFSFCRGKQIKLGIRLPVFCHSNHLSLPFSLSESTYWAKQNQNWNCTKSSEEFSQLLGECHQHLPFCPSPSLHNARVVFTLLIAMFHEVVSQGIFHSLSGKDYSDCICSHHTSQVHDLWTLDAIPSCHSGTCSPRLPPDDFQTSSMMGCPSCSVTLSDIVSRIFLLFWNH